MKKRKKTKLPNHLLIFALVSVNCTILFALAYANFTTTKTPTLEASAVLSVDESIAYTSLDKTVPKPETSSDALATQLDMLNESLEDTPLDKIMHEPKAIITYQKNSRPRAKRHNMSARLGLVEAKFRELKDDQGLATELTKITNHLDNLRQELGITSDIDPRSLMGPLERAKLDRQHAELQQKQHQQEVRDMKKMVANKKRKYEKQMAQMKQRLAAKKSEKLKMINVKIAKSKHKMKKSRRRS